MDNRISPAGPLAGNVITELLTPFMVYAELLKTSGSPAQSKMVWALGELRDSLEAARLFLVPRGSVLLWHGSSDAIPKGWAICDGTQGTPDLRDRFVIGAGGKYGLEATGGTESATPEVSLGTAKTGISLAAAAPKGTAGKATTGVSVQNASVAVTTGSAKTGATVQNTTLNASTTPSHQHLVGLRIKNGGDANYINAVFPYGIQDLGNSWGNSFTTVGDSGTRVPKTQGTGGSSAHSHGISDPGHTHSASAGQHGHGVTDPGHTHAVTTTAHGHTLTDGGHSHTVSAKALKTMPPYVALFYIKKL